MLSNLFLVQVNSSSRDFAIQSMRRLAGDMVMWAVNFGTLAMLGIILYSPIHGYLKLAPLSAPLFLTAVGIAAAAVFWYEIIKLMKRLLSTQTLL